MKTYSLNTLLRLMLVATALTLGLCILPASTMADEESPVVEIQSVPKVFSQTAVEQAVKENKGIPWFNGTGTIESVTENGFVVDDLNLFGTRVDYRSEATGQPLPASSFRPGVKVGYVLNSKNVLVSLWMLKKQ